MKNKRRIALGIIAAASLWLSTGCAEYMARRRAAQAQRKQQIEEQKKQEQARQQEKERKFKEELERLGVSHVLYAFELFMAYERNEIAADQKFKSKKVMIVGPVKSVARDVMKRAYAEFAVSNEMVGTVQCY
ncbi:MAG: OB-fold protein, partial [Planctomycetota bacterium]